MPEYGKWRPSSTFVSTIEDEYRRADELLLAKRVVLMEKERGLDQDDAVHLNEHRIKRNILLLIIEQGPTIERLIDTVSLSEKVIEQYDPNTTQDAQGRSFPSTPSHNLAITAEGAHGKTTS